MPTTTTRPRLLTAVLNRWPTALALAMSLPTLGGNSGPESVDSLGNVLPILPLLYLVMAKIRRRAATWPLLAVGLATVVVLRLLDVLAQGAVYAGIALVVFVWAGIDGQLRRSGTFQVQALGMLGFGALAFAGIIVDPEIGRYLVAAGWFLHGVWDVVHLKLDKVVARSFAEWCAVVDVIIAVELVASGF